MLELRSTLGTGKPSFPPHSVVQSWLHGQPRVKDVEKLTSAYPLVGIEDLYTNDVSINAERGLRVERSL